MQGRLVRTATATATALLATLTVVAVTPTAAHAGSGAPLSRTGCEAFNDYFQVNFAIAFLTGFAEAFEDLGTSNVSRTGTTSTTTSTTTSDTTTTTGTGSTTETPDTDQLQNLVFLVLSPKLERATSVLARQAPKQLRPVFKEQRDVYREGVEILRDDVGLTDEQIEEIRETDFTEDTPAALADDVGIDEADLEAAAERFGENAAVLTAEDATPAQGRAFEQLAIGCGSVPDTSVDCDELVGAELQERLLGGDAAASSDDGTCTYTGAAGSDGDEPILAVDVYRGPDAYDRLVEQNDETEEIDDDTAVVEGFTTFSRFKTCGRTMFTRTDDAAAVIALCAADDVGVTDADLTDVRDAVVEALG